MAGVEIGVEIDLEPTPSGVSEIGAAWPERMVAERDRLKRHGQGALKAAGLLAPFQKPKAYQDLKKLVNLISKTQEKLKEHEAAESTRSLLAELEAWIANAADELRQETGRQLRDACQARAIEFRVERRDAPVLLRIPPFGVEIDFAVGKSTILFAKLPVATCGADAPEILATRDKLMGTWESGFDPAAFHRNCRKAWRAARAAEGTDGERVEILTFLPYLALQLQNERFAIDPSSRNFKNYGRAHFAYDVNSLRQRRELDRDGYRLCLGVATGNTAQQKKRVVYFEDGNGVGEFKLTVYFTAKEPEA